MRSAPVNRGCTTMRSPVERSMTTSFARRHDRMIVAPATRRASADGVTSRSTSALATRARTILLPLISASRSRAIVSVSGSSGTAAKFAPANVGPVVAAAELDVPGVVRAQPLCLVERRCDCGDRKDAPAGGHELACVVASRSGVKDEHVHVLDAWQSHDVARLGLLRIAQRRDHRCDGMPTYTVIEAIGQSLFARDARQQLEKRRSELDEREY